MNTIDYNQPKFYHSSQDSIELVNFAVESLKRKENLRVLDLCCGCGIIGIEFALKHKSVSHLTFFEKQKEFGPYLEANIGLNDLTCDIDIVIDDLANFNLSKQFDLILCNPPFYLLGEGRLPSDKQKQICHFFSMSSFKKLEEIFLERKSNSLIYCLGRMDQSHIKKSLNHGMIKLEKRLSKSIIYSY